ncbi:hypothetical protein Ancab_028958, partial [Ancistrocladus abbreviatus]
LVPLLVPNCYLKYEKNSDDSKILFPPTSFQIQQVTHNARRNDEAKPGILIQREGLRNPVSSRRSQSLFSESAFSQVNLLKKVSFWEEISKHNYDDVFVNIIRWYLKYRFGLISIVAMLNASLRTIF